MRTLSISRDRTPLRLPALPLIAVLLMLGLADVAEAIDPHRAMSQYIRDRWGSERGFPGGPVYAFAQTNDGYLWIGAESGLVRFDGIHFQVVSENFGGVSVPSVHGLLSDREGNLWVRTSTPWMFVYRDGSFHKSTSAPYANFATMCRSNEGNLLASAAEQGIVTYRNGKFEMLANYKAMPRSPAYSVAQTSEGQFWVGTRDAGLFRFSSAGQPQSISRGLPDPKVNTLLPGKNGELWVGTDRGVARWNGSELTPVETGGSARRMQALAMIRDRDANLWVGTDSRGLLRINKSGTTSLNPLVPGAVTAVFEDREGSIWFGNSNGIERLRDSPFVTYSPSENLPTGGNSPVFVDGQNRMWFSPASGGLWWSKDGDSGRVTEGDLDRDLIYSITGTKDELWIGRQRGGLTSLQSQKGQSQKGRPQKGMPSARTYNQKDGLAQNSVYSVFRTRTGEVWAGTLSGGVSRLSHGKLSTYTTANGLSSNTVSAIAETAEGTIWFGTSAGLSTISKDLWRSYTTADGLPSASINCLLAGSGGELWVGTAAGLAVGGSGGFKSPNAVPAILREPILGIAEDQHGWLWVATANHVFRLQRNAFLNGSVNSESLHEYGVADGLRSVEGVKRHRSVVADSLGRIWIATSGGISVVDPARLANSSAPAIARVQSITADGRPIDVRDLVRIPGGGQRITFGYAGLSLSIPERVRFRYSLAGFDQQWSEPVSTREAVYTNLGPGKYRFRVISSNPDGVWNSGESSIAFEIEPLFWQTWWFCIAVLLSTGIAIAAIYRFRLHQLTHQLNVRFDERLAERTRIAQELHDTLLQGFLSASMQLYVATDKLADDSPAKPPLGRVQQLMAQVIEEGRNAVRGLRSPDNSALDLGQAFLRVKEELGTETQATFQVIVQGQPRPLHPMLRDEVYRIGREALVNAFRHSNAKDIEMELEYAGRQFRFLVRDNGHGIDPEILNRGRDGHWGLRGMRERAERIGGQLHVWSSFAAGTEVQLSVPGNLAFPPRPGSAPLVRFARLFSRKAPVNGDRVVKGNQE
ncbi:MAG: hypothetical protein H7039_14545 [Bryobacteraceae bacterium]|nr:hypothetical protein [Bryobacteraceae bacterium]